MLKSVVFVLTLLIFTECKELSGQRKQEKQILDNILSTLSYDARIRPNGINGTDGPVEISVNMYVWKINRVDDDKMLYSVDVMFRQQWVDERLQYASNLKYITLYDDDYIWTPDLFFNNFKGHVHEITKPNILLRIFPDGNVLYSKRYSMLMHCSMDLSKYPFDQQECEMRIESYAWQATAVNLKWKAPWSDDPVVVSKDVDPQLFKLEKFWTSEGKLELKSGVYTYLTLTFQFKRQLSFYIIQIFNPCTMLAIIAYGVFWVDIKQFTARIILALATLYTMSTSLVQVNMDLPRVPYTKAIDIFTGLSLTFVFVTVIETLFVHFAETNRNNHVDDSISEKANMNGIADAVENKGKKSSRFDKIEKMIKRNGCHGADALFRLIYPILYLMFQLIYWTVCLSFN